MGVTPVPPGEVATVVTMLEMRERPPPRAALRQSLELRYWKAPPNEDYRALFRRVGAPWLWYSRLAKSDEALGAILGDARTEVHAVCSGGERVGFVELDFTEPLSAHIVFLGLVPERAGKGHGRWLMDETIRLGWRAGIERLTVQTCSLDHPAALPAYRRAGFDVVGRALETFPDPRVLGVLDPSDAPQVPLVRAPAS